ncbi:unnamed protein product [Prunus armeniaca]|uniref:Aminotransferase-like plant mobile domain-containing protein n=1 Tax=Prunus armeniaca TaxID=36596 RepID=A0A6J5XIQ1_PRUAR|nr:unnamed protein product [Prunus armeniaca]
MARKEFANLEYRSDVLKFHRVMERIRANVRESHVELFRRTPFWGLFSSYHGGLIIEDAHRKSDIDIVSILKCFDKEDLDKMPTYAWAIAAKEYLQNSLLNMNSVESACGCVVSLLFWVCERTQLINPINGREKSFPNFVKWNLLELYARMKTRPLHALKSMEPNKDTSPKTPIEVNQSVEIKTTSGGKTVEPYKTSVNEFDNSKMFQLLPTQMMDCNQESSPKTPTKGNQTVEIGINKDGRQSRPTKLLWLSLILESPSNSKVDIYDMERILEELNAMLDAERPRN